MDDDRRVVVIGTGPSGAAAARVLYEKGIRVTVLEAGSEASANGLTVRAPGLTLFRRGRPAPPPEHADSSAHSPEWHHEESAGGLSNHWTCAVPRFAPEDFFEGEALGERFRWPLGYTDLVPHYAAMERWLHIGGSGEDVLHVPAGEVAARVKPAPDWSPVATAANARGHGLTSVPLSYAGSWTTTPSGTPFNSFVRMLATIPRSDRFEIRFDARALRIEGSTPGKLDRVIYRSATGREESIGAHAVVLAAGCVNSTRLLLESRGAASFQGIGNGEGLLGRYLHDHPLGKVMFEISSPLSIHPPVYISRAAYGAVPPMRGTACSLWSGTAARMRSYLTRHPGKNASIGFNLFSMLPPKETNSISLTERRDPSGAAGIKLSLSFGEDTEKTLVAAREELASILGDAGLHPAPAVWKIENPGVSVHLGGTARMHASPKHGVVDAWNRVHSAPEILVVDAAAFTTGPEKNPTLTAMALASRACTKLAEELR